MAEEPMLINFSLGANPIHIPQKFTGGRWRDRRGLTKSSRNKELNGGDSQQRPYKRQRLDTDSKLFSRSNESQRSAPPNGVVSSLFSFNPTARSCPEEVTERLQIQPSNAPLVDGIDSFTSLGLTSTVSAHLLSKLDLKAPTAIQKAAIPRLVNEISDAFVQAETGSGKTLAYLLPIINQLVLLSEQNKHVQNGPTQHMTRTSGLFAIILAPTRELSKQIHSVLESLLGCARWIVSGAVIGGEKKKSEKARLRKGFNILVATPGRLVDHLEHTEVLNVSNVRWLILDEGDRLMELGFEEDIKKIIAKLESEASDLSNSIKGLPLRRRTILCSATMRNNTNKLGELTLSDAIHIQTDPLDEPKSKSSPTSKEQTFSAPAQLQQSYIITPAKQRLVTLHALLKRSFSRRGSVMKAIVFFSCADSVDFHSEVFTRKAKDSAEISTSGELSTVATASTLTSPNNPNIMLYKLYGNLTQQVRTATLKAFSIDKNPAVMFCTDVASRGLDLPSIDLVVEYDPAFSAEEHLHRIGRTARAGKDGRAVIFLMPGSEESYLELLRQGFKDSMIHGSTSEAILKSGFAPAIASKSEVNWENHATEWQLDAERWVQDSTKMMDLAKKAYISHVRAYATHTGSERHIFDVKDLHLGHLAKAFALREKPSNMSRMNKEGNDKRLKRGRNRYGSDANETEAARSSAMDPGEATKQMRKALRAMNPASEFNIA